MDNKNERFQLLIPASILERIKKMATRERRSVSNMIVVLLEEALSERKKSDEDSLTRQLASV